MPYWTPADEICHHTEAGAIAKSLFPERDRENRFFIESPRKIFAHLLKYHPSPKDLCDWIARPDPEIDRCVAGTPLEAIIAKNAPQQRSGVLAVLERVSSAFSLLPARRNAKWSATVGAERRTGWVFVTTKPQTREILRPLISLWLDFLLLRLTVQTEPDLKPVWVILDELASLETQFYRLAEGQHPQTGEQLVRHRSPSEYQNGQGQKVSAAGHRAGWDATFRAPKSLSITALVGGDEGVREAHRESVHVALNELERNIQARIGGNHPAKTPARWLPPSLSVIAPGR